MSTDQVPDALRATVRRCLEGHGELLNISFNAVTSLMELYVRLSPDTEKHRDQIRRQMVLVEATAGRDGPIIYCRFEGEVEQSRPVPRPTTV